MLRCHFHYVCLDDNVSVNRLPSYFATVLTGCDAKEHSLLIIKTSICQELNRASAPRSSNLICSNNCRHNQRCDRQALGGDGRPPRQRADDNE